jgi:hypothetical protein
MRKFTRWLQDALLKTRWQVLALALLLASGPVMMHAVAAMAAPSTSHVVAMQLVPGTGIVAQLLNLVLPMLIGGAATWLFAKIILLLPLLNALEDWEKRVAVVVVGVIVTGINHALGVHWPEDLGALTQLDVVAAVNSLIAFLFHRVIKVALARK